MPPSCSATSSAPCAGPMITGARIGTSLSEGTWTDRATNYLFVGTVPALLLVWHGVAGGRLLRPGVPLLLVVGVVALLYALGRYTPGFGCGLRPCARREALPAAGGCDLPHQHRSGLRRRIPRAPLHARWAAATRRRRGPPRLRCRPGRRARVAAIGRAPRVRPSRGPAPAVPARDRLAPSGRRSCCRAVTAPPGRPRGRPRRGLGMVALTGREWSADMRPQPSTRSPRSAMPCSRTARRSSSRACKILKDELADAMPRASIRGSKSRPRRRHGRTPPWCSARGHHRLQSAAAGRLRAGRRSRRECRRPEPAPVPGDIPRLQVPARELSASNTWCSTALSRVPRHFPHLTGDEVVYGSGKMWVYRLNVSEPPRVCGAPRTPVEFGGGSRPGRVAGIRPRDRGPDRRGERRVC